MLYFYTGIDRSAAKDELYQWQEAREQSADENSELDGDVKPKKKG